MLNRREFLKSMGIVGAGILVAPKMAMGEVIKAPVVDAADIEWTSAEIDMSNAECFLYTDTDDGLAIGCTRVSTMDGVFSLTSAAEL